MRSIAVGTAAALLALIFPVTSAGAQTATNYVVPVGAELDGAPGESMRFFPSTISVHDGDTITFVGGFHTATLLPSDTNTASQPARTDVAAWVEDNAGGLGKPYSVFTLDPDDGAGALKANNTAALGPGICGTSTAPCSFDGSQVVNSGLLFFGEGFTVEVNGDAGDVFWGVCLLHTHMRMRINIVAEEAEASTQSAIDTASASTLERDSDLGVALDQKLRNKQSKHTTANGTVVWDAWAGYDAHQVTLFAMYPRRLNIKKGQRVRWHFNQLVNEIHTATFPLKRGLNIAAGAFETVCDPDGDSGTEPDTPPTSEAPPFCDDISQLEFDIPKEFGLPSGNGKVSSKSDFENSAVRGPSPEVSSNAPFTLQFTKASGDTPFKYLCLVHPFMRGKVVVRS